MTVHATITSKNQMTVPAELRADLGLKPGDKVRLEKGADGTWRIAKSPSLASLSGIIKLDRPISDEELRDWIAERRGRGA